MIEQLKMFSWTKKATEIKRRVQVSNIIRNWSAWLQWNFIVSKSSRAALSENDPNRTLCDRQGKKAPAHFLAFKIVSLSNNNADLIANYVTIIIWFCFREIVSLLQRKQKQSMQQRMKLCESCSNDGFSSTWFRWKNFPFAKNGNPQLSLVKSQLKLIHFVVGWPNKELCRRKWIEKLVPLPSKPCHSRIFFRI